MIKLSLVLLALFAAAAAQESPGKNQRRAPGGMTAGDGIAGMVTDLYGQTPAGGGYPPARYFSQRMQALIAADRARPVPRVASDWLRRPGRPWPDPAFHAWVLNTSGGPMGGPASATVSLGFDGEPRWGRRLSLIDEGGYWVIDGVCMFPGGDGLASQLTNPGPTEPGHQPGRGLRGSC